MDERRSAVEPAHRSHAHAEPRRRPDPCRGRAALPDPAGSGGEAAAPGRRARAGHARPGGGVAPPTALAAGLPQVVSPELRLDAAGPSLARARKQGAREGHDLRRRDARRPDARIRPEAQDGAERPQLPALGDGARTRSRLGQREPGAACGATEATPQRRRRARPAVPDGRRARGRDPRDPRPRRGPRAGSKPPRTPGPRAAASSRRARARAARADPSPRR